MIKLTKNAAVYVRNIAEKRGSSNHLLVKPIEGGCSGLYYDIVFGKRSQNTKSLKSEGVKILIDKSVKTSEKTVIDYIKIFNSPSLISSNPKFRVNLWIEDY